MFFEAMGLHRTLDLNSNPIDSTQSRIIQTNDKLSGNSGQYEWAQDVEGSRGLFCDVRYVTMDELPWELSFIVA